MRNSLFQESRTKDCRAKLDEAKLDELSMIQQRNPQTVSQLLAQMRKLQEKVNSMTDAREFHDPETASSCGASHVTNNSEFQNYGWPRIWIAA